MVYDENLQIRDFICFNVLYIYIFYLLKKCYALHFTVIVRTC